MDPDEGEKKDAALQVVDTHKSELETRLAQPENPYDSFTALLGLTTYALEQGDKSRALEYAKNAYELEGLSAQDRLAAAMSLINVYGDREEYDKGLELLGRLRQDSELVSLEGSNFYMNRIESAYKDRRKPDPLNCQEPITPEDCPVR